MNALETLERAIARIQGGDRVQAVTALADADDAALRHAGAAVELLTRDGTGGDRPALMLLQSLRPAIADPGATLVQIALELIALGRHDEAMARLAAAGGLFAGRNDPAGLDRIAEIVGTLMDAGLALSHRHLRTLHAADRWQPDRWARWFATGFLRQANKLTLKQADRDTLRWIDELTEDALAGNTDEEAVRAWIGQRASGRAAPNTPLRELSGTSGASTLYDGRTLNEIAGVFGDVESVRLAAGPGGIRRQIVVRSTAPFNVFQRNYLDSAGWPIPNTEIRQADGALLLHLNSLGCRGPEPSGPTLAVFGSSETFGMGGTSSWPERIAFDGVGVLNAAMEGYPLSRMLARYRYLQKTGVDLVGVLVCAGWHNLIYNENTEPYWEKMLAQFLDPARVNAFATIATALTPECRERGLDAILARGDFVFWGNQQPTKDAIARLLDQIAAYNDLVQRFCRRNGAVLVDLHAAMLPRCYEDIPADFFDINHFRIAAYDKLAKVADAALGEPVGRKLRERQLVAQYAAKSPRPAPEPASKPARTIQEDGKQYIYTLW